MIKKEPVSVNWQTVFMLIPIVSFWAFYRIEKLRLCLLIFVLGFGLGGILIEVVVFPDALFQEESASSEYELLSTGITLLGLGVSIVLIRKWSREWNEKISRISYDKD